jgi:hypothetical protein
MLEAEPRPVPSLNLLTSVDGSFNISKGHQTAFRRSTLSSLPASSRARCMNPQPQPRIILVLRHPTESLRLNLPTMPDQPSLELRPVLSMRTISRCTAANSNSVPQPLLLNHIQNPEARATGGFLPVAVSEVPLPDHRDRLTVVMWTPQIQHQEFSVLIPPRRVARRFGARATGANHQRTSSRRQSLLVLNDCSERMLKSMADPLETQQAIESALAIPKGLP